MTKFKVMFAET